MGWSVPWTAAVWVGDDHSRRSRDEFDGGAGRPNRSGWERGTTRRSRVLPSRSMLKTRGLSTAATSISDWSGPGPARALPSTRRIRSPGRRPPSDAGDSAATPVTTAAPGVVEALDDGGVGAADGDADVGAADPAELREIGGDTAGAGRRDDEADALVPAADRLDRRVDPDDLAFHVHQRAARVAGVDRGVGLDQVLIKRQSDPTPLAADDPGRDGIREPERLADRQDPVAGVERVGVAPGRGGQAGGVDRQEREVALGIAADLLDGPLLAAGKDDDDTRAPSITWWFVSTSPRTASTTKPDPPGSRGGVPRRRPGQSLRPAATARTEAPPQSAARPPPTARPAATPCETSRKGSPPHPDHGPAPTRPGGRTRSK